MQQLRHILTRKIEVLHSNKALTQIQRNFLIACLNKEQITNRGCSRYFSGGLIHEDQATQAIVLFFSHIDDPEGKQYILLG